MPKVESRSKNEKASRTKSLSELPDDDQEIDLFLAHQTMKLEPTEVQILQLEPSDISVSFHLSTRATLTFMNRDLAQQLPDAKWHSNSVEVRPGGRTVVIGRMELSIDHLLLGLFPPAPVKRWLGTPTLVKCMDVTFRKREIVFKLSNAGEMTLPLELFPGLEEPERRRFELSLDGHGVHFPDADEDILIDQWLVGRE